MAFFAVYICVQYEFRHGLDVRTGYYYFTYINLAIGFFFVLFSAYFLFYFVIRWLFFLLSKRTWADEIEITDRNSKMIAMMRACVCAQLRKARYLRFR